MGRPKRSARHGPVALVHVDAHADVNESMFGEAIAHGTPFRRAVEERLLASDKVFQIGLRGTGYEAADFDWPRAQGLGRMSRRASRPGGGRLRGCRPGFRTTSGRFF